MRLVVKSIAALFFFRSWSHRLRPKKLSVSVAVPPAPVRVSSQRPLTPSDALVTSVANDKGDNEMILGAVHRPTGICLTAEENSRKHQLRDEVETSGRDEGVVRSQRLKWGPFPPDEVGRIVQHVRKGEGRKGGDTEYRVRIAGP